MKQNHSRRTATAAAALFLVGAANMGGILVPVNVANAAQDAAPQTAATASVKGTVITVSGAGEVMTTPDIAVISVGVQTQGKDSAQTAQENADKTDAVIKAVKALGVADKDIQTENYNIYPQFDYQKQPAVLTGYQVTNSVRVTVRKIADAGKVLDAALKQGANVAGGISFDLSDPQAARDAALEKAVADAARKASRMARAAGATKPLVLIELNEGMMPSYRPPMPMMEMAMAKSADAAPTPVQPGETKITATVTARYVIPAQ